jgi:hypothetical protein
LLFSGLDACLSKAEVFEKDLAFFQERLGSVQENGKGSFLVPEIRLVLDGVVGNIYIEGFKMNVR